MTLRHVGAGWPVSDELSDNHRVRGELSRTLRDTSAGRQRSCLPFTAAPELLHAEQIG
jgi:hypothetical protein